jgi:membrane associated rhomboid family serine protease
MMQTWQDAGGSGGRGLALPGLTPVVKRLLLLWGGLWGGSFLVSLFAPGLLGGTLDLATGERTVGLLDIFGVTPGVWFDVFPWVWPWQPFTYGWLHSPSDPLHLLFNGLGLYFFGTLLESLLGSRRFLSFVLAAMVVAGCVTLPIKPLLGSYGPTVGASGAVLAIMAAAATLQPRMTVLFWFFPLPLAWLVIGLVSLDAIYTLQQIFAGARSATDHVAHLAGAAAGFLAVRRGWIWRDLGEDLADLRRDRQERSTVADAARLDELLARIHDRGIQSLSASEKAFLKRMSQRR